MQTQHCKKGEAYIDTVVTVLLSLIVLALAINMFLFMYKYQKINDAAEDAVKYAAIVGEVNTSAVNQKTNNLLTINGVDVASTSYEYKTASGDSEVQYGDTILLEMKSDIRVGFSNSDGFITIPVKITKTAISQKYYKPTSAATITETVSGGNVIRVDNVSEKPHNVNISVHGASQTSTTEEGATITENISNPTVSVYGKNLHTFNYKNIRGYTFSGSNCKIVNPTQFYENPNNPSLLLPAGTYTFSCRVTGSREYANKRNFSAFFYIGETQTNIEMNDFVSGTRTFKKTFTVTEPTAFRFNNVWFIETPTSADLSLDFQLEVGGTATEFEEGKEPHIIQYSGELGAGSSWSFATYPTSPTMTIIVSDDNSLINWVDVEYKKKIS